MTVLPLATEGLLHITETLAGFGCAALRPNLRPVTEVACASSAPRLRFGKRGTLCAIAPCLEMEGM